MASKLNVRLRGLRRPLARGALRHALIAAITVVIAAGAAVTLATVRHSTAVPRYLQIALGPKAPPSPLARRLVDRSNVTVRHDGFTLANSGARLSVASVVGGAGAWSRHRHGVVRRTPFGFETINVGKASVEESLVVAHHVGRRTWRWRLSGPMLTPSVRGDGSVGFYRGNGLIRKLTTLSIEPAVVQDTSGARVTPKGAHWQVEQRRGSWWLTLTLDDTHLPTPYVIDPIAHDADLTAASQNTGGAGGTTTTTGPVSVNANDTVVATFTDVKPSAASCTNITATDSVGNTLTRDAAIGPATATAGTCVAIFHFTYASAQTNVTYTFTHDGSTDRSYSISTYTGIGGVDVIGAGNVGTTAASCTTTCALPNGGSNTLTTGASGGDLLVEGVSISAVKNASTYTDTTASPVFTATPQTVSQGNSRTIAYAAYALNAAASTAYTTTGTTQSTNGGDAYAMALVAYKASAPTNVAFSGSPQTGGAHSDWNVGFTSSASGPLSTGSTIKVAFNSGFTVPATPTVTLGSGFSSCTASATAAAQTVTITLAGVSCSLPASTAASLTIKDLTNPAAGTLAASTFSVSTSGDPVSASPASGITIAAATSVGSVSFSGSTQAPSTSANWTEGFTTSSTGAMSAGDTITIVFPAGFTVPAAPTVTLGSGFTSCTATATGSGTTATVTLVGASCSVAASTAASLTLNGLTNPASGSYAASGFSVKTSRDTVAVNPASAIMVSNSPTNVSFSGSPQTGGARSDWTESFKTSSAGALSNGATITIVFNSGLTIPATPTIVLNSGFTSCTATGSTSGTTVTVTLSGASCSVSASTTATLTVKGLTNPAAGGLAASTFSVATSKDLIAANPASAVTINAATSVSSPAFSGSVQTGGSAANWTETFTTSASGALSAGDTISLKFNASFTIPATPTVVLNSGFTSCTAAGSTSSNVVTVTLSGASCAVANSAAVSLTVNGITNPANGSYAASTFSIATSRDTAATNPASAIVIASPVTGVSFSGSPQTGSARSDWTVGFTTSSSGALAAGGTITIAFNAGFTVPATPTIVLGTGFTSCTATGSGSGTTVTVTLAGASCAVANSTAATLTVQGLTNPAAGTLTAGTFSVATSGDTVSANPVSSVTIAAATSVSTVTFSGSPQTGGARSTWTVSFKSSATGALRGGDAITVVFNSGFAVPATPTVALTGGFSNCTASATASGPTATITLAGASCTLAANTTATLTLAALTNPAAGSLPATTLSVKTATDTSAANPASSVTVAAATTASSIGFSGSTLSAGSSATWTVGFTTSSTGALGAGDTITVVFPAGFTIPATPTITLPTGFATCSASASTSGQTVTITLANSGGTCSLPASTAGTLTIAGITNPAAGTYAGSGFTVKTSRDTATASPGSSIDVYGAASQIVFTTQPGGGTAGTSWSTQPVLTVEDSGGRVVANYGSSVTVAIKAGTGAGGATLSGTGTVAASNGIATFSGLSIDKASTTYQLHATSGALTAADSTAFTISAAAAQTIALNGGNGQSATVNTSVATAPSVLVTDSFGNPVPGVSVTFAVTGGGGSVTGASQSTNSSGIATVGSWKLGTTAGSSNNGLSASSTGLTGSPVGFTASATPGSASTVSVSAPGSATAGTAFSVTVTARDVYGNTATGYTGTVHFTGGGAGATLPSDYTFVGGDNGAHTFTNGVTLTQAGNRTVTVTDTVTGTITGSSGTIAVGAAGVASLSVTAPAGATAGSAFSVTVTALDTYGNTATSYAGTVHFSGGGTGATLPSNYAFVAGDNGTHTFTSGVALTQAGSRTVTATDTVSGSIAGTSSTIAVAPAGASTLSVNAPASATAGSAFSVTVMALDAYGNTATGYTGTVHFTGGGTGATLPSNYTFVGGDNGTHTFTNGATLTQAGSRTVTATDTVTGSITGTSSTISVSPAGASTLSVTAPASATAGSVFSVTVTALDAYGNTATGYTGTVHFTGGGTGATLPSNYTFVGGDNGTHTFTNGVTLTQAGGRTVTATDAGTGTITGTSSAISLSPAGASTLTVTAPASATAGSAFSVTVTALDAYGNTATGYTGTVHFTGGGSSPTLPTDYTFVAGDNGVHTFSNAFMLTQAGSRSVTTTDTVTGSITGASGTISVAPAGAATLAVTAPAGVAAGSAFSTTVTAIDAYGNTATGYTGTVHFTGGGTGAALPSDYTFSGGDNGTHTFTNGVTLTEGGSHTITATDTVTGTITGTSSTIAVSASATQLDVAAPASATAGSTFSVTVTAKDAFGNVAVDYTGTVHLTGGGTGATLPSDYTFVAGDNGTHTFTSSTTLTQAGSRTLTATDTVTGSITGASPAIAVAPAGASTLTVTAPASATAGTPLSTTVTALDAYGNTATGYTGTVHFTGGGTGATLPSDYTFVAGDNGVHTFTNGVTLTGAGSRTLAATDTNTSSITGASGTISVVPAGASTLTVTAPASATAGNALSVTLTALDAYGNTATGYTGTVHFTGGGTGATLPSDYTFTAGDNGTHTFTNGVTLTQAGNRSITATDTVSGSISGTSSAVAVGAASAHAIAIQAGDGQSATVGAAVATAPAALVTDQYGNPVAGVSVTFAVATGGGNVTGGSQTTNAAGIATAGSWTLGAVIGANTLTATSTGLTGNPLTYTATATADVATSFTLSAATTSNDVAGTADDLTITARDQYGNVANGFGGLHDLTFAGASSIGVHPPTVSDLLGVPQPFGTPTTLTFVAGTASVTAGANGALRLYKAESASITATDSTDSISTASPLGIGVVDAAAHTIAIDGGDGQTATVGTAVATAPSALVTDQYGNPVAGTSVTFAAATGGGNVTGGSQTTNAAGIATVGSWTVGTLVGANTLTATGTGLTGSPLTYNATSTPDSAASLTVSAPANATAGTAFSVTVTAKDQYGNTATGYTGTVHFTGGGSGGALPSDYTFAGGDNGTHTFTNAFTLTQAGSRSLTATDTATASITGTSGTISLAAAGASTLTVSAPGSATAGSAFSVSVTAFDQYGNQATGYTGTIHFTGGGAGATLPSNYTFAGADNGTHTFTNGVTLTAAGSRAITAADTITGSITGTSGSIAVSPAAASTLSVSAPASATAGGAFSVTVTALDAYGNTATGYTGTVHLTGGGTSPTLPSDYTFTGGDFGVHTFSNAFVLTEAGNRTLTATDTVTGSIAGTSGTIGVSPAGASTLAVTAPPSATAGSAFSATVTALDAYGNTATGYTGTVHFTGGGTGATLPSDYTFAGGDSGVHTFTNAVTVTQAGGRSLTVTDTGTGSITGTSGTIAVSPAGASTLTVTAPASATAGSGFATTVTALDAYGNTATGYTGTIHFTGGGAGATLPSDYTFTGGDNGTHTFNGVTLAADGTRTLTATDTVTGSITGTSGTIAIGPAGGSTLAVTAPAGATAGAAFSVTVTAKDAYGNTATGYTGTVTFSGGGTGATLPADYTFVPGDNGTHTFANGGTLTQAGNRAITATDAVASSITGTSSTIAVSPSGASTLTVTAPASATAGNALSATVTALDAYGNTAAGYTGTVHFTGGGTGATLPADYTFTGGDNGTHTFTNGVTLTQAGSRAFTATDTNTGSITGTSGAISVSPAGASTLTVTAPGGATAGSPFSVTVTAHDAYGNTATGYTGIVHFTGGGTGATLPADYTFTGGDNGTHTFTNGAMFTQAGNRTLTGTDTVTGSITGASGTIAVSAAPLDATVSTVGSSPGIVTANGSTTSTITVTATDAYGNPVAGATTSLSQGAGHSSISPASTATDSTGTATFTVKDTTAETAIYQATVASTLLTHTTNVQFVPGAADGGNTTINPAPASIPADGSSTSTITLHAKDAQGNALTSSGGVVTLSTDHGSLSSVTDNHDGTYTATLTASTSIETATVTGTIDGNAISAGATVSFTGVPSKYLVTSSDYAPAGNSGVTLTAQLADQDDNPTGVAGKTITWSKTGPGGSFSSPTSVTNASGIATVTFTTGPSAPASYTVTATDDSTPSNLTGTSPSISTSTGGVSAADSTIGAAPPSVPADGSTTSTVTVTLTDSLGNPISGKTVTLTQPGGASSSISAASGPSDSSGHVTFTVSDLNGETVAYSATDTTDSVMLTQTASVTFVDSIPPTIAPASPADGATGSGTVTLAASGVGDPGSGVASVTFFYCDSTASACVPTSGTSISGVDGGSGNWTAALDTTTLVDGHSYTWVARAADNAGNHTDTAARTLAVDNSTPSLTLGTPSAGASPGSQYYESSSKTLWLNSSDSGSFQLAASASDAQSGVSNVRFSALLGTGVTDDATSPYQSAAYNFAPGANSGTVNVTAFNGATVGTGNNSRTDAFTIAADTAAPGGFALGAPLDASTIGTGVTVSAAPTDGQSGLRQVAFYYCDLSGGPCAPSIQIGLIQTVPVAGVYAVSWDTTGLTDGHSYAVAAVATDNVGHTTTSIVSTVTVDNSAPSVSVTAPTGAGYYDAANKRFWLQATGSGSFTLHATASDADSGIAGVTFPALFGTSGNTDATGPYDSAPYTFNNATAPGSKTIVAANGVTNPAAETASDSIDVEVDGSSPTTIQTFPLDNGSYQAGTWNGNCAPSGICGTVTDAGSGVAQVNVSIKDRTTGKYWGGAAFDQSAQTFNAASVAGNNWHYALDESDLTSPHSYLVEIYAVDNVGNADVHQQFHFTFGSDTGGPSNTLSLTNATHAYLTPTAPYVLYYGTGGGGGFKLHASATDPSGVDTVTFPDLSATSGFTGSGGMLTNGSNADPYTVDSPAYSFTGSATSAPAAKNVNSADLRGNVSHDQVTFVLDNTAPTGGSLSINGGNAYSTTTAFAVSHTDYTVDAGGSGVASSALTVASAALSNNACGTFGSPTPVSDGTFNGSAATCYRFALTGTDNIGNVATTTFDVKVDTTAPSQPTVTFGNLSSGNTYDDGAGTLYYRPSAGGTFRVDAASTDAESGVQGYTFSPLTGFASTSQSGGSLSATFNGSSTGSGAFNVHATNNAGLDSPDATYNVTADSTAPSGGSLTVNGTAATGAGSSSYLTSGGSVTVATTPYSDGGSGLASQAVTVQQASLSNDTCGTYGAPAVVGGASYGVANGNCYLFTITATDNVGNVTTAHTMVKIDTTAPVAPGISFTGASAGNTFVSGSTLYYRPSAGGAFTVNTMGASDPETGIAGYTFSTLSGFTGATQTGNHVDITFDGSSTGGGAYTVVANNNAGVSSAPATGFAIAKDSTAPAGGLLSINPYSGSLSVGITKTDFTDAGSGIASNVVTRSNPQAPVAGACPVGGYTGANAVTLPNDTVPADGRCYQYTLTGTDNVGNAGTYSTNVLVDTTGPAGGSVSYANGPSSLSAISVDWDAGTDAESGIAQVRVDRATAPVTAGACGSLGGFSTIVANATVSPVVDSSVSAGTCYAYRIVVTNNAGVSSTFTSAAVAQLMTAVPFEVANAIPSGASLQGSTLYLGPAAANQPWKLQLTTDGGNGVTQATWQGKSASPLSSAPTTDSVPTNPPFDSGAYTWDGTPVNDTIQLTRDPGAQIDLVHVVSDLTDPTGSISYTNGTYASHSVHITTSASDADSGVAGTQVQRASAPLTGATCGSWTGYSSITLNGGGNDTTVTDNTCYSYQLVVTDKVGNQFTATSPNVAEIPDITPPTFVSAATNVAGTQLAITMSEPLDSAATTPASAFTVTYDGVAQPTPTGISVSGSTVTLDLVNPPDNSQVVRVRYTQPSSSGDRMRDLATPTENETASFGPAAVTNSTPDTVAPSITSASVDGATLTLGFDEALAGAAPDPSAFTITAGATGRNVTNVAMSGNVVTLTLASPVTSADAVDVSYAVPALNALHDATGNTTAPFTRAAANQTPVVTPPAAGGGGVPSLAPSLIASTPDDGLTVPSVATITLDAGQAVTWTNVTVTRPDGSVASLPDAWGSSASWPFAGTAPGLYVVRGRLSGGGQTVDLLSHFTVWTQPLGGTGLAPPVEKNGAPDAAGELVSADGSTDVAWPPGAFADDVVVEIAPRASADFTGLPAGARVVSVTAFLRSTHAPVTTLGGAIDIRFSTASSSAHPLTSEDGKTWSEIPQLRTLSLGSGQSDGWFRDSDGTIHVLARHLSYYAIIGEQAAKTLSLHVQTARRLWLEHRSFVAVRLSVSMPARVTGNFVAADGTVVPGQTVKTPTRHAGVTILRVPLRVTQPGVYRLELHAEGGGQAVDRSATIRFLATKPHSPVWQHGAVRVAVIRGAGALAGLGSRFGSRFVVRRIADAGLYSVVDPASSTAAAAVVVDLATVPTYTLAGLHALLPEVTIVGLGGSPAHAAYYRSIGVTTLLPRGASAKRVAAAVRAAIR